MKEYIFVSFVIDREAWLHDLGGLDVSYILDRPFGRLDDG